MSGRAAPEAASRQALKEALRTQLRTLRHALGEEQQTRSERIVARLVRLPEFNTAQVVAGFVSIQGEVDLAELWRHCWKNNKQVALPSVVNGELVFRRYEQGDGLIRGKYNVPEPPKDSATVVVGDIDFFAVPALAVDHRGNRIGYGGGYYDRLLARAQGFSCVTAFDLQLIAAVETAPHDVPVNAVVTETRILRAA